MTPRRVIVAPRELHDLVYRSCRVAHCDAGTAEVIAENVTFSEIVHGSSVAAFCKVVDDLESQTPIWGLALDEISCADVETRLRGKSTAKFNHNVPLAAIALCLHQSATRGAVALELSMPDSGSRPISVVQMVSGRLRKSQTDFIERRLTDAHQLGVKLPLRDFRRLEQTAAPFLVSEPLLDAIEEVQ